MITSLIQFHKTDNAYHYELTQEGKKCQFLQFLINTSNFAWCKIPEEVTEEDKRQEAFILLSKLCAIGYLIFQKKRPDVSRAVIATDYMNKEPGRSGKTLFVNFIAKFIQAEYITGRFIDINNAFIWNDLSSQTKLVVLDDLPENFEFDWLFPCINGDWVINRKGKRVDMIPYPYSPKIVITTFSEIAGKGVSVDYRKWELPFSDYYNASHSPIDDFGKCFFTDWDIEDWKYAYMLIADCVQLYLNYGPVLTQEILWERKIEVEIGTDFVSWADIYFSNPSYLNQTISRKKLYDLFLKEDSTCRKYVSSTAFKQKLAKYCNAKRIAFSTQILDGTELFSFSKVIRNEEI